MIAKKCPNCGRSPSVCKIGDDTIIKCPNPRCANYDFPACGCEGGFRDKTKAIKAWNSEECPNCGSYTLRRDVSIKDDVSKFGDLLVEYWHRGFQAGREDRDA